MFVCQWNAQHEIFITNTLYVVPVHQIILVRVYFQLCVCKIHTKVGPLPHLRLFETYCDALWTPTESSLFWCFERFFFFILASSSRMVLFISFTLSFFFCAVHPFCPFFPPLIFYNNSSWATSNMAQVTFNGVESINMGALFFFERQ